MKYDGTNLNEVLEGHKRWLEESEGWSEDDRADLSGAYLSRADLRGADLRGAKNMPFIPMACPDTGAFIGWKQCQNNIIVKLLIPEDAKRSSATGRKCRCDKAVVLDIQDASGNSLKGIEAISKNDKTFVYSVGDTVRPKEPFDDDRFNECASGIHFFINREEAVRY